MPHTVSRYINTDDGTTRNILIEPVLTQASNSHLEFTGVYTIYKGNDHGEAHLLELQEIAPEIGESLPLTEDVRNPDFLGRLTYNNQRSKWEYTGGKLSAKEQGQIVEFIQTAK
ncbi:hypothetical protein [Mucilaginibacter sp. FT3.2]|uniref:hypothetical protein n=1 Tax=Mucilaginibacter sp. FT3.2 TaxID=2723090 RepID=UPI00160AC1D9|nr:hypothetical protein [Mucilaginibacter sp. FT3.2]MBB6233583.1 hypothetical protein [Mucilaginibacter sp. FT3.2]